MTMLLPSPRDHEKRTKTKIKALIFALFCSIQTFKIKLKSPFEKWWTFAFYQTKQWEKH